MAVSQPTPKEFQPYRKLQSATEAELRKILEATAKAIQRRIAALPVGVGGQVRAAQLRVTLAAVNALMRQMWVGRINPLLERAIHDSLQASEDAIEALERVAYAGLSERAAETLVAGLRAAGASGLKSDAARRARALSRRVFNNRALDDGRVEQIIRQGLISGLSAKELAADVYKYVSPTAPGGSAYSAMRLARTEINNAFHERQIEGAKRPGVEAVKWNLSGSHKVPDECNLFAAHKPYPPDEVPDKPHPNCFCYLTYVMMPPAEFKRALEAGDFDAEIDRRTRENMARLGQRVGQVDPPSDRKVPKNTDIKKSVLSGVESSEKLTGGVSAETSKVKFKDGTSGVRKFIDHSTAKRQQDAEELVPLLARMMGLKAAQVMRVDEQTTIQQFLSGKPAMDALPWLVNAGTPQAKKLSASARAKSYVESDDGWLMAVMDQITGNQDRHDGNWLVQEGVTDRIVGVIDHGLAYSIRDWRTKRHDPMNLSEAYIFRTRSEFTKKFAKTDGTQTDIDFHPDDLEAIAGMMTSLRKEYEDRGRLDWWQFSMRQIEALRPFAKGKKRRIQ